MRIKGIFNFLSQQCVFLLQSHILKKECIFLWSFLFLPTLMLCLDMLAFGYFKTHYFIKCLIKIKLVKLHLLKRLRAQALLENSKEWIKNRRAFFEVRLQALFGLIDFKVSVMQFCLKGFLIFLLKLGWFGIAICLISFNEWF